MDRFQDRRLWLLGGALSAVLILAVAWLTFIGPELSSSTSLRNQAATTRQQNAALSARVAGLRTRSQHVGTYIAALERSLDALPPNSGLPAFLREVSVHAAATDVQVQSVLVGGVAATTPTTGTTTPATSTSTASTATDTAAPTSTAASSAAGTPGGLYAISVTLQTTGSLQHQLAFLARLRTVGPRSVLVTSAQFGPGAVGKATSIDGSTVLSAQLSVFTAPQSPSQLAQLQKLLSGKIGN